MLFPRFHITFTNVNLQVSEVLSLELASTKNKLEKAAEQSQSLEQTKKIAFQQHELYEQEIRSLEQQIENTKKVTCMIELIHTIPSSANCQDLLLVVFARLQAPAQGGLHNYIQC